MAYDDAFVGEALVRLAQNKYDFDKTADQLSIPVQTLRRWNKKVPKKNTKALLERAIERMLINIPETWNGHDWAIAVGILLDKLLLYEGKATQRIEQVFGALSGIPDDELDALLREAEAAAHGDIVADREG